MPDSFSLSPAAVVGAGALGSTLAQGLDGCGYPVAAVLNRSREAAQALGRRVGAPVSGTDLDALPSAVRFVAVCVPDESISPVADALSGLDHPWGDTIVAHTSGAKTAAALDPLAHRGAATMSFHPLQTFPPGTLPTAFEDIVVGLEGHERAVRAGTALAHALGARPVCLSPEEKVRYHCAAALASNGLVALMGSVEEVFGGIREEMNGDASLFSLVGPLVAQTLDNLETGRPEEVLTGPVQRGDVETVRAHLDALSADVPHLIPLYATLSAEMVQIAVRGGDLSARTAEKLLAVLRRAADASSDGNPSAPLC